MRRPFGLARPSRGSTRCAAAACAAFALMTPLAATSAAASPVAPTLTPSTALSTAPSTAAPDASDSAGTYLVVLRGAPAATYDGSTAGFARTAPRHGHRFDADRPAVRAYEQHLIALQDDVLGQLGSPEAIYHYTAALNGFAARLTSDQVESLREHADVLAIERSRVEHVAGGSPGDAIRLAETRRVWSGVGGPARAGKHVVIGLVDSGIWPENPSFAGVPLDRSTLRRAYRGFTGGCQSGDRWSSNLCNDKVISARYFVEGFGADRLASSEFTSPRDGSGHGSHTAAIAAGNAGVAVHVGNQNFGQVSGVAPAAAIAVYKACWAAPDPSDDGCATPDTAKAVDQAVRDGVDVLNYSVSGHDAALTDVVELAFLNAAAAGVFVSAAAGDEGPTVGSVNHSAPWVTTVGASTNTRYQGAVVLGNGRTVYGSMASNRSVPDAPLVYAGDVPSPAVGAKIAGQCRPWSLDARKIDGAIVLCDRGVTGRVTKSQSVAQAGGVGMVLVNNHPGGTAADLHAVPTVHVTRRDGKTIERYLHDRRRPTAALDADGGERRPRAVADFSSRGPATVTSGDVLKPDLVAPGVSVLAAVAPPSNFGHLWDIYSGSSMAAPEVSGLAAIVSARHPGWSPATTKSALMTTARPIATTSPLDQGAGEVAPDGELLDPGLAYDARLADWLAYLEGNGDAVDLNAASIAVGSLVGEETVTRTVTNVGRTSETYTASVDGVRGVAVSVSRPSFTLRPGQSTTYDVTFSARKVARYGHAAAGALIWRGSHGHRVRTPVVVRPELVRAPDELQAPETTGGLRISAVAGVTGTLSAGSAGLVGARPDGFVLSTGSFDVAKPSSSSSTKADTFSVPAGSSLARVEVRGASPGDDLDLYLYRKGDLVAQSVNHGGDETITLTNPRPGAYTAYAHASAATGDLTIGSVTGWVLDAADRPAADDRNDQTTARLSVGPSPVQVTGGRRFGVDLSWRGLDLSRRWLAVIRYDDSDRNTVLTVN